MRNLEWFLPILQGIFLGLLAMTLHEVAHLLTARLVGIRVKKVGLRWKGLYTVRDPGSPRDNAIVSLAGPLLNLALLLMWHWSPTFGLANLCFFGFNVLPIEGSDGERVWKCWLQAQKQTQAQEMASIAVRRFHLRAGEFTD
ncbi:MAG TPA: hypothetical protein VMU48_17610 [Terracidiphilus sp.]|nr:hypothetical protein [Terracidiphilus sp.]